jgi:hypothetical protein
MTNHTLVRDHYSPAMFALEVIPGAAGSQVRLRLPRSQNQFQCDCPPHAHASLLASFFLEIACKNNQGNGEAQPQRIKASIQITRRTTIARAEGAARPAAKHPPSLHRDKHQVSPRAGPALVNNDRPRI